MKNKSIIRKIFIPVAIAMFLQAALFFGVVFFGGTVNQLKSNAFDIMSGQVESSAGFLESEMLQRWSNVEDITAQVNETVGAHLAEKGLSEQALTVNSPFTEEVLSDISDDLVYLMRRNMVTDVFVVFEGGEDVGAGKKRPGLMLRDPDPTVHTAKNSDLVIERAPLGLSRQLGIATDAFWEPSFSFSGGDTDAFYNMPTDAAYAYPTASWEDLGYWSPLFRFSSSDTPLVTYSVPLVRNGHTYGVLGVGISQSCLLRQLAPDALASSDADGSFLLGVSYGGEPVYSALSATGALYSSLGGSQSIAKFSQIETYPGFRMLLGENAQPVYGRIRPLALYSNNSPFESDQWVVVGLARSSELLYFPRALMNLLLLALVLSLAIGFASIVVSSGRFIRPVLNLMRGLQGSDPNRPIHLQKTGIGEIDALAASVEQLSARVARSASQMSRVLESTNVPIAAFEVNRETRYFSCTSRLASILNLNCKSPTLESFRAQMEALAVHIETRDDTNGEYLIAFDKPEQSWVSLRMADDGTNVLGVVTDVTSETQEKRRMEYERDYDSLTGLLNRRGFQSAMEHRLAQNNCGVSAFLMMDLDNLKYINDTYGHDFGDSYICCAAGGLRPRTGEALIAGRISGDEFQVFLHGFRSKEDARAGVERVKTRLREASLYLPGGSLFRMRASGGIAWYPEDADTYEQLSKFADFAMYRVKNTSKGEFTEFDRESYRKESYLLEGGEELNRMIEEQLVDYHFQPIADAHTGEIHGYEALMRPRLSTMRTPQEVLTLARRQFRLQEIERLTLFCALSSFAGTPGFRPGSQLFVNSISNQSISDGDILELENRFTYLLPRIVLELTEEEENTEECTQKKLHLLKRWNSHVALDDYGAGYSNGNTLVKMDVDYIKMDMAVVRGIDTDTKKQRYFTRIVSYSHERGARIVAEGVETRGEMEMLISLGADYLQGYYIARPGPEPVPVAREVQGQILRAYEESHPFGKHQPQTQLPGQSPDGMKIK